MSNETTFPWSITEEPATPAAPAPAAPAAKKPAKKKAAKKKAKELEDRKKLKVLTLKGFQMTYEAYQQGKFHRIF